MLKLLLASILFTGCYIPPQALKVWEEDRLHRRGASVPCSAFRAGQVMGGGDRVIRVTSRSVTVRSRSGSHYSIACR
jgi:hypothetical protein